MKFDNTDTYIQKVDAYSNHQSLWGEEGSVLEVKAKRASILGLGRYGLLLRAVAMDPLL